MMTRLSMSALTVSSEVETVVERLSSVVDAALAFVIASVSEERDWDSVMEDPWRPSPCKLVIEALTSTSAALAFSELWDVVTRAAVSLLITSVWEEIVVLNALREVICNWRPSLARDALVERAA